MEIGAALYATGGWVSMADGPEYEISVATESGDEEPLHEQVSQAVRATLRHHSVPGGSVSVAIVDDDTIASLNRKHLDHSGPTDVLTFDLRGERGQPASSNEPVDGEIVMSVDTAKREAAARGHTSNAELALYAVHGTLHLLGYDDHEDADAQRMHAMENLILTELGLGAVFGTIST